MNEHSTELKTINFRFLNEFHQKLSIKQLLFQLDLAEKKRKLEHGHSEPNLG